MTTPKNHNLPHLDAAQNVFFARELESIKAKTYDKKYAALKGRTLIPVSYEAGQGTKTITYRSYSMTGVAKHIASYADDLPRADAFGEEFTSRVHRFGVAFGYTLDDIRSAAKAGKPLEQAKADAARRGWEVKLDDLMLSGDSQLGMVGLNGIANANTYAVPNGAAGTATWATKTPDEILADLFAMDETPTNNTKEVEWADTLVLPEPQLNIITRTRLGSVNDTTIKAFFLAQSKYIKNIVGWHRLTGAGNGATDRMISYRNDPDALWFEIPEEFEMLPPEQRGLETLISCIASAGGVICPYPLSVTYGDGI